MKFRKIGVLAAVASAVVGLSACQSRVGAAAVVDGHRISESEVTDYLTPQSTAFTSQNQDGSTTTIVPKNYVVSTLVLTSLFERAIEKNGKPPTEDELAKAKARFLGTTAESDVVNSLTQRGFDSSFEPVYLRERLLYLVLQDRLQATQSDAPIVAALKNLKADVHVNPVYGAWDAQNLNVTDVRTPDYLEGASASATSAAAG